MEPLARTSVCRTMVPSLSDFSAAASRRGLFSSVHSCQRTPIKRRAGCFTVVASGSVTKKHVLITGGNTGIGKATAIELARQGMVVTIACRDQEKGTKAASEIAYATQNPSIRSMVCDLASLQSVRHFAEDYKATKLPLHVLVNNAGVMACPQAYTEDGFEQQLGVNHLGHFLLTALLLDKLKASALSDFNSRIVVLASKAEVFGKLDYEDLNFKGSREYQPWLAYGQSKLANILFAFELGRRCKAKGFPITSNCMHPGIVATELARYLPWYMQAVSRIAPFLFNLRTPEEGAATAVHLASSPAVEGKSIGYYEDCQATAPSVTAQDEQIASKLWSYSENLTKSASIWQALELSQQQILV